MNQQLSNNDIFGPGESRVEDELIGKWFPRIGALAIVLGAGFGFKYAIDQGWIGPRLRVMVGILISSLLIGIGDWTRKKDWSAYAQAITGGGVALLYLTLWATVGVYGLVEPTVGFVLLMGVSGLGCALALRHESQTLALISILGGFLNPFVTGASTEMPEGLYAYTLAIDLAVVLLGFFRPWRTLERVAFTVSWIVFEVGHGSTTVSLIAATGIFLMFGALPYARVLLGHRQAITDLAFVPMNGLLYYFAVFVRMEGGALDHLKGPFTLAMGVFFLIGFLLVKDRAEDDISIGTSSAVLSFGFITLWSPIQLGVELMPLGWAIQGALLFAVAHVVRDDLLRWGGWIAVLMATVTQLVFTSIDPNAAVDENYGRFVFVVLIGALFFAAHNEGRQIWDDLRATSLVAANGLALLWLSLEVYSVVSDRGALIPRPEDLQFGLSGIWALYAGGLLVAGIVLKSRMARLMSVIVFGVTLAKMAVHDLWLLDTLQRLIGFMGIGILLLACSLLYHRFKIMLATETTEEVV